VARKPNNDPKGSLAPLRSKLSRSSRYRGTKVYPYLGPALGRWGITKFRIPESSEDSFHKTEPGERFRLDLIAHRRYDDAQLWWVLALANDIRNPFMHPNPGEMLRVPPIERIRLTLLSS